jgi:hypothetical protein
MNDCAGTILRSLAASGLPAALELSEQAGWNQTADDWHMLIDLAPEGCLAIEVEGDLAATTTLLHRRPGSQCQPPTRLITTRNIPQP